MPGFHQRGPMKELKTYENVACIGEIDVLVSFGGVFSQAVFGI